MARMTRFDFDSYQEHRNRAYLTIFRRHPMLGVDHCVCGEEVVSGRLVLVVDDGNSQKVVGCFGCGRV
jgi:hypothetical protein